MIVIGDAGPSLVLETGRACFPSVLTCVESVPERTQGRLSITFPPASCPDTYCAFNVTA